MKFFIIYWIIGVILGYILIPNAAKELKKDHEGYRDLFSQVVQDYYNNIIINLILILIVSFIYPFLLLLTLIDTIKGRSK
jgi:hypothetical protein